MCIYILLQYFRDTQSRVFGSTSGRNHNTRERNENVPFVWYEMTVSTHRTWTKGTFLLTRSLTHPPIQGPCLLYIHSYLASTRKTRERLDVMCCVTVSLFVLYSTTRLRSDLLSCANVDGDTHTYTEREKVKVKES